MFKIIGNGSFGKAIKHVIINSDLKISDSNFKFIIPAVPSYAVTSVLENENLSNAVVIFVSKGLLEGGKLLGEWANQNNINWASLGGPHFASEIIQNLPTYSTIGYHEELSELCWKNMNVSFSPNKLGIQMLGSLKNIFACFFGIIHGLNLGKNFSASMFFIVLEEIKQILNDMFLNISIINTAAGIGDLTLTCNSKESRNFKEGYNRVHNIHSDHLSEARHSAIEFKKRFGNKYKICDFIGRIMLNDIKGTELSKMFYKLKI